ncbi:MAG TPA: hypothetical protein DCP92_19395 [Nitrospiraceae bacterium]|jgi:chemotaxis protein methyltransferase CheR|nr:hypothetical protein [Nitrospiraceae bacterium]
MSRHTSDTSLRGPRSAATQERVLDLSPFRDIIKNLCGLSFDEARTATLKNGIQSRMSLLGLACPARYLELLKGDEDEFNNLVSLLTINETYFFRDPAHFQLLTERLVPALIASKKPAERLRMLSAGCSTGEEPYSIVMALMEKYGESARNLFSVTGIDIDSSAFEIAKRACYNGHSFREFPEDLKSKYFDSLGPDLFRIKGTVCKQVEFQLLNLLSETYPVSLQNFDIIFYRNVAIYFDAEDQKTTFSKLSALLNENGYLVVSSTETLAHNIGIMSLIEIDNQFLYQKKLDIGIGNRRTESGSEPRPRASGRSNPASRRSAVTARTVHQDRAAPLSTKPVEKTEVSEQRRPNCLFDKALSLAEAKKYDQAVDLIDAIIAQDPSFCKAYTLKASVLINMKELDKAEGTCLICIQKDQWCLEAFLLLGMIAKIRNDDEAALQHFKESLYIQSSCWIAHFYIAEIHRLRGELNRAYREYEIVTTLLKKGNIKEHGLTFFPLSFPMDQIAHLCNHNMTQLRKKLT